VAEPRETVAERGEALCKQCGLCCSGEIFDVVPVDPDEAGGLRALGIDLIDRKGGIAFPQPCVKWQRTCCSIYSQRPRSCRSYSCSLLDAVEADTLDLGGAHARIAEARRLIESARPFFEVGETAASARKRWREGSGAAPGTTAGVDPRFHLAMTALNLFLDKYFRKGEQKQVVPEQIAPKR
jgi:Fe-S-cluster containining protein